MKHDVFGEIQYEDFWKRSYEFRIFGENSIGALYIDGDKEKEIWQIQVDAFKEFEVNKNFLSEEIEKSLFDYYQSVVDEYRDRYGDVADEFAPLITDVFEMKSLVKFEAIDIPYSFVDNQRVVGVLFESKWEIEHGVAIKIINGEIVEVGYQDIVL